MKEARRLALKMARPSVSCAEIDGAMNAFLDREGYSGQDQRLHRTGYGFGLSHHEGPFVAEGSHDTLAENMVISIEPGIYLEEIGGFRHSDTIRVTKNGYVSLTNVADDIDSLTRTSWKLWARIPGTLIRRALRVGRSRDETRYAK